MTKSEALKKLESLASEQRKRWKDKGLSINTNIEDWKALERFLEGNPFPVATSLMVGAAIAFSSWPCCDMSSRIEKILKTLRETTDAARAYELVLKHEGYIDNLRDTAFSDVVSSANDEEVFAAHIKVAAFGYLHRVTSFPDDALPSLATEMVIALKNIRSKALGQIGPAVPLGTPRGIIQTIRSFSPEAEWIQWEDITRDVWKMAYAITQEDDGYPAPDVYVFRPATTALYNRILAALTDYWYQDLPYAVVKNTAANSKNIAPAKETAPKGWKIRRYSDDAFAIEISKEITGIAITERGPIAGRIFQTTDDLTKYEQPKPGLFTSWFHGVPHITAEGKLIFDYDSEG